MMYYRKSRIHLGLYLHLHTTPRKFFSTGSIMGLCSAAFPYYQAPSYAGDHLLEKAITVSLRLEPGCFFIAEQSPRSASANYEEIENMSQLGNIVLGLAASTRHLILILVCTVICLTKIDCKMELAQKTTCGLVNVT
ncbi:hypothetical protein Pelo_15502 [Pelomyxa schiedti]|nr:hypothetical protein Pelo_15502 [Pelomyxa schiedti]